MCSVALEKTSALQGLQPGTDKDVAAASQRQEHSRQGAGNMGESQAEKILVRFLFVVFAKPEGCAGRWSAAVHASGISWEMPLFKLFAKS